MGLEPDSGPMKDCNSEGDRAEVTTKQTVDRWRALARRKVLKMIFSKLGQRSVCQHQVSQRLGHDELKY